MKNQRLHNDIARDLPKAKLTKQQSGKQQRPPFAHNEKYVSDLSAFPPPVIMPDIEIRA